MERLTYENQDASHVENFLNRHSNFDGTKIANSLNRLAEYEDTGLTPEEIQNSVRVHREMWEEKYYTLRDDRDYWKAEALKHGAKLGDGSKVEIVGNVHENPELLD